MPRLGFVVEDTEDTIVRPRHHRVVAGASRIDAFADTVLAPPPTLVEPPEPPRSPRPVTASAPGPTVASALAPPREHPATAPGEALFHRIRVGDAVYSLEAPAFVGRHPSTPRVLGSRAVRLVRVPSPGREVSATHASFRQEGGAVVVTDLGSTNGTVVEAAGTEPVALRPGDSMVVLPGGRVLLGDSIVVEILGTSGSDD